MVSLIDISLIAQLFILINPLSSLSVLVSAYKSKMDVRKIAYTSVIIAFILAIVMALIGPYLFSIFNVTLDSFRIAGGIVLLLLGIETIRKKEQQKTKIGKVDSLISIIATPLLTGPATISFITIKAYEMSQMLLLFNIVLTFILVSIVFIIFAFSIKKINLKVVGIISRVLGLFLASIGIGMIIKGIMNAVGA